MWALVIPTISSFPFAIACLAVATSFIFAAWKIGNFVSCFISPAKSKFIAEEPSLESVKNFDQLIKLVSKKREIELKYDLERNVNLVKFSEGKIDISLNDKLGQNFIRNLSEKL